MIPFLFLFQISIGSISLDDLISQISLSNAVNGILIIENIHLCIQWIPHIINCLKKLEPNPNSKIWFTSQKNADIPQSMLEYCHKITIQQPNSIQKNTIALYQKFDTSEKSFSIFQLHSALVESCNYSPQSFTKPYEFGDSDAFTAFLLTKELKNSELTLVIEDLVYSGRIENAIDLGRSRCLISKLLKHKKDSMCTDLDLMGLSLNSGSVIAIYEYKRIQSNLRVFQKNGRDQISPEFDNQILLTNATVQFASSWKKQLLSIISFCSIDHVSEYSPTQYLISSEKILLKRIATIIITDIESFTCEYRNWNSNLIQNAQIIAKNLIPIEYLKIRSGSMDLSKYMDRICKIGKYQSNIDQNWSPFSLPQDPLNYMNSNSLLHIGRMVTSQLCKIHIFSI